MENSNGKNPGKMLSLLGLILGIISGIAGIGILIICWGWASFDTGPSVSGAIGLGIGWTVLTLGALMLCMTGRKKSKAAGSKTGLGTFGMVVAILALLNCGGIFYFIHIGNDARLYDIEATKNAKKADSAGKDDAQRIYDSMMNSMNGGDTATKK